MKKFELYQWDLTSSNYLIDKKDEQANPTRFCESNKAFQIRKDLYPEPHIGNVRDANVILLALNPGVKLTKENSEFDCEELKWYDEHKEKVSSILEANLKGQVLDYPYFYLNPTISNYSPGHSWLKTRIRELKEALESIGVSNEDLSKRIACVQFFPYHSLRYKHSNVYLPSQIQNFKLVLDAMEMNKTIICMRSIKLWNKALLSISNNKTQLTGYKNLIELKNARQPYLTKNNMLIEGSFEKLIAAISV